MTGPSIATKSFIRDFGDVRAAHYDRHACGANGVSHAVCLCNHPCHRADADESNILFANKASNGGLIHRLRIAVNKEYLVSWRGERLEQEHPEVRHKIAGHSIVRIEK